MLGQSAAPVLPPRSSHRCCVHAPVHNAMPLRASDAGCTGDGADAHATAISSARVQAGLACASDASCLREVSFAIPSTSAVVLSTKCHCDFVLLTSRDIVRMYVSLRCSDDTGCGAYKRACALVSLCNAGTGCQAGRCSTLRVPPRAAVPPIFCKQVAVVSDTVFSTNNLSASLQLVMPVR
mmetsp:Transcript_41010/g.96364  ORF Transcript_41010/g.96364 Transcript_41010/m.96364 type:complete len:181 (+) Transcript_41010:90-632(+)